MSQNPYADLGLKDADILQRKSEILWSVILILDQRQIPKRDVKVLLGIDDKEFDHIQNGHSSVFSEEALRHFLEVLAEKNSSPT